MLDDNIDGLLQREELKGRAGQRLARNFDRLDQNGDNALSRNEYNLVFMSANRGDD